MWEKIAGFVPGLGPAFTALFNPWIVLGFLAALGGSFLYGMHEQTIRFEAAAKSAQDSAINGAVKFQAAQRTQNAALSDSLVKERSAREKAQRDLRAALAAQPRAALTDVICPSGSPSNTGNAAAPANSPQGNDGGSCRLSVVGVRLWNSSLALGIDDGHRGQFTDDANREAGPVEINEALANVADNASLLGECRDRELGWQVKACQNKWFVGAPCDERLKEFAERK